MAYATVASFLDEYRKQNPQFKDWGDESLYSIVSKAYPDTPSRIEGAPAPKYTDWPSFIKGYKEGAPQFANTPDIDLANQLRQAYPFLKVLDAPPETPEQRFIRTNPNWVGRPLVNAESNPLYARYQKIQQDNSRERQGFLEALGDFSVEDAPFFVGDAFAARNTLAIRKTAEKLSEGQDVSDDELLALNLFLADGDRDSNATIGGKVGNIVRQSVTFGADIAAMTILTSPLGGAAAAGKGISGRLASRGLYGAVKNKVEDSLVKWATKAGGSAFRHAVQKSAAMGAGAVSMGGLLTAGTTAAEAIGAGEATKAGANTRMTYDLLQGDAKEYWKYYMADIGSNMAQYASEFSGEWLAGIGKAAMGAGVLRKIGSELGRRIDDVANARSKALLDSIAAKGGQEGYAANLAQQATKMKADKRYLAAASLWTHALMERKGIDFMTAYGMLKGMGYDGILEEFGEERVGGFFEGLMGNDGGPGGFKGAFEGALPDSTEDAVSELIAFTLPMAWVRGVQTLQYSKFAGGPGMQTAWNAQEALKALTSPEGIVNREEREKLEGQVVDQHVMAHLDAPAGTGRVASAALNLLALPFTFDFSITQHRDWRDALAQVGLPPLIDYTRSFRDDQRAQLTEEIPDEAKRDEEADARARQYAIKFMESNYNGTLLLSKEAAKWATEIYKANGVDTDKPDEPTLSYDTKAKRWILANAMRLMQQNPAGGTTNPELAGYMRELGQSHVLAPQTAEQFRAREAESRGDDGALKSADDLLRELDPAQDRAGFAKNALLYGQLAATPAGLAQARREMAVRRALLNKYRPDSLEVGALREKDGEIWTITQNKDGLLSLGRVGKTPSVNIPIAELEKYGFNKPNKVLLRVSALNTTIRDTRANVRQLFEYDAPDAEVVQRSADNNPDNDIIQVNAGAFTRFEKGVATVTLPPMDPHGYHLLEDTLHALVMASTGEEKLVEPIGQKAAEKLKVWLEQNPEIAKETPEIAETLKRSVTSKGAGEVLQKLWLAKKLGYQRYEEGPIGLKRVPLPLAREFAKLPDDLTSIDEAFGDLDQFYTNLLGGDAALQAYQNPQEPARPIETKQKIKVAAPPPEKVESVEKPEEVASAVQKREAGEVPVGQAPAAGPEVGKEVRKPATQAPAAAPQPAGEAVALVTRDTVVPGQRITLYRGEGPQSKQGGDWWTSDIGKARRYAAPGQEPKSATFIATRERLMASATGHGGADEWLFPDEGKRPPDFVKEDAASAAPAAQIKDLVGQEVKPAVVPASPPAQTPVLSEPAVAARGKAAELEAAKRLQRKAAGKGPAASLSVVTTQVVQMWGAGLNLIDPYLRAHPELAYDDPEVVREALSAFYKQYVDPSGIDPELLKSLVNLVAPTEEDADFGDSFTVESAEESSDDEASPDGNAQDEQRELYEGTQRMLEAIESKRFMLALLESKVGRGMGLPALAAVFGKPEYSLLNFRALKSQADYETWRSTSAADKNEEAVRSLFELVEYENAYPVLLDWSQSHARKLVQVEITYPVDNKAPSGHAPEPSAIKVTHPGRAVSLRVLTEAGNNLRVLLSDEAGRAKIQKLISDMKLSAPGQGARRVENDKSFVIRALQTITGRADGWDDFDRTPELNRYVREALATVLQFKLRDSKGALRRDTDVVFDALYRRDPGVLNSRFQEMLDRLFQESGSFIVRDPAGKRHPVWATRDPIDDTFLGREGQTINGTKLLGVVEMLGTWVTAGEEERGTKADDLGVANVLRVARYVYDKAPDILGTKNAFLLVIPSGDKSRVKGLILERPAGKTFDEAYEAAARALFPALVGDLGNWSPESFTKRVRILTTNGTKPAIEGTARTLVVTGGEIQDQSGATIRPIGSKDLRGQQLWAAAPWARLMAAAGMEASSNNYKAFGYVAGKFISKPNHAGSADAQSEQPDMALMNALQSGYQIDSLTDQDAVKFSTLEGKPFNADGNIKIPVTIAGEQRLVVLRGSVVEIPYQAYRATTNLETSDKPKDKATTSPVAYDMAGARPETFQVLQQAVMTLLSYAQFDKPVRERVLADPQVSPQIRQLLAEGVPVAYYGVAEQLRPRMASRLLKLLSPSHPSTYQIVRAPFLTEGIPGNYLRAPQAGASAWVHANVAGARYGARVRGVASRAELSSLLLAALNGDVAAQDRLLKSMVSVDTEMPFEKLPNFADLVTAQSGNVATSIDDAEITEDPMEPGQWFIPGSLMVFDRVPGGPSAHFKGRLTRRVSNRPVAEMVVDGATFDLVGFDTDGDKETARSYYLNRAGLIRGLQDGDRFNTAAELSKMEPAERERRLRISRMILGNLVQAEHFRAFSDAYSLPEGQRDVVTEPINTKIFDNVQVTATLPWEQVPAEDRPKTKSDVVRLQKPLKWWKRMKVQDVVSVANQTLLGERAQGSTDTRAFVVAGYRQLQYVARYGRAEITFAGGPLVLGLGSDVRRFSRPAVTPEQELSDRLAAKAMGNLVNIVIDDIKEPASAVLNMSRETLGSFVVLLACSTFKTEQDVQDFVSWWTRWSSQPHVARFYNELSATFEFDYLGDDRYAERVTRALNVTLNTVDGDEEAGADVLRASQLYNTAMRLALWGRGYNSWKQIPNSTIGFIRTQRGNAMRGAPADMFSGEISVDRRPEMESDILQAAATDVFFLQSNPQYLGYSFWSDLIGEDPKSSRSMRLRKLPVGQVARWSLKSVTAEAVRLVPGWFSDSLAQKLALPRGGLATKRFLDAMGPLADDLINKATPEARATNLFLQLLQPGAKRFYEVEGEVDEGGRIKERRRKPGIRLTAGEFDTEVLQKVQQGFMALDTSYPEGTTLSPLKLSPSEARQAWALYWALTYGLDLRTSMGNTGWVLPPSFHRDLHGVLESFGTAGFPKSVSDALARHLDEGLKYNYPPSFMQAPVAPVQKAQQIKKPAVTSATVVQTPFAAAVVEAQEAEMGAAGEISSDAKGLNAALTNPTELAKIKGNLKQSYPVTVRGTAYKDAEAAFQALKPKARMAKTEYDRQTDVLMREILEAKFRQHPRLAEEVKLRGGKSWIETATHRKQDKNWGGEGRGSRFIAALADAYEASLTPVAAAPAEVQAPQVATVPVAPSGFLGYRGGFESQGKGTARGDGKDQAMRQVANAFIGELAHRRPSSTLTSAKMIGAKSAFEPVQTEFGRGEKGKQIAIRAIPAALEKAPEIVVMLARNGELRGEELLPQTVDLIKGLHGYSVREGGKPVRFVLGDMPGVDDRFMALLEQLGATFEIYHTGSMSRIKSRQQPQVPATPTETPVPAAPAAAPTGIESLVGKTAVAGGTQGTAAFSVSQAPAASEERAATPRVRAVRPVTWRNLASNVKYNEIREKRGIERGVQFPLTKEERDSIRRFSKMWQPRLLTLVSRSTAADTLLTFSDLFSGYDDSNVLKMRARQLMSERLAYLMPIEFNYGDDSQYESPMAPRIPAFTELPGTRELLARGDEAAVAFSASLVTQSMEAAQDLVRRLEASKAIPPMPDSWVSESADNYRKLPSGKWETWNGPRSSLTDPEALQVITEEQALAAWKAEKRQEIFVGFSDVAQVVEEWKRANNIKYDPQEAYSRGEGFYHDIGAFNPKAKSLWTKIGKVLLSQGRALRKGELRYWESPESQVVVSAYTQAGPRQAWYVENTGKTFLSREEALAEAVSYLRTARGHYAAQVRSYESKVNELDSIFPPGASTRPAGGSWARERAIYDRSLAEARQDLEKEMSRTPESMLRETTKEGIRPGSGPRIVVRPSWQDIVWAAVGDVYSGTAWQETSFDETQLPTTIPDSVQSLPHRIERDASSPSGWRKNIADSGPFSEEEAAPVWVNISQAEALEAYRMHERYRMESKGGYRLRSRVIVETKAPQADKLSLLAHSIAAAIEGRRPENYNELGIRLRLGNFYIEDTGMTGESVEQHPMPDAWEHPTQSDISYSKDSDTGKWYQHYAATFLPEENHFEPGDVREVPEAFVAESWRKVIEGATNVPKELQPLNRRLKQAFMVAQGSLDPVAPYKPKEIRRASGATEAFSASQVPQGPITPLDAEFRMSLVDLGNDDVQVGLLAGHEIDRGSMASLSTTVHMLDAVFAMDRVGQHRLPQMLIDWTHKGLMLQKTADLVISENAMFWGMGPDHVIVKAENGKIKLRHQFKIGRAFNKDTAHKWTPEQQDMIRQRNWVEGQLLTDRTIAFDKDGKVRTAEDLHAWARKDPKGFARTVGDVVIDWGIQVAENPFADKKRDDRFETVSSFEKRWAEFEKQLPQEDRISSIMGRLGRPQNLLFTQDSGETGKTRWITVYNTLQKFYELAYNTIPGLPYFRGYAPLLYGHGFADSRRVAATDAMQRYLRAVGRDGDSLLTETEYEWDFGKPSAMGAKPPAMTKLQIDLLRDLTKRTMSQGEEFDEQQFKDEIASYTMWDANAAIKDAIERLLIDTAAASVKREGDEYKGDVKRTPELDRMATTLNRLNRTIGNYRHREWTARSMSRRLRLPSGERVQTFVEAAKASKGRTRPRVDAITATGIYAREMAAQAIKRVMLNHMVLQQDYDGKPLILMEPSDLESARDTGTPHSIEDVTPGIDLSILHDDTWRQYGDNLARYSRLIGTPVDYNPDEKDIRKVRASIRSMVARLAAADTYQQIESPYPSVSRMWAVRGETADVLKHIVQIPARWMIGDHDVLRTLHRITQWSKIQSVGWSIFFPLALMESVIAGTGLKKNVLWYDDKKGYSPVAVIRNMKATLEIMREMGSFDHNTMSELMRSEKPKDFKTKNNIGRFVLDLAAHGIDLGRTNIGEDQRIAGVVQSDTLAIEERVRQAFGEKTAGRANQAIRAITGQAASEFFFGRLFPAIKIWAAYRLATQMSNERLGKSYEELSDAERDALLREVAPLIDNAYGGVSWARHPWATPKMVQMLNFIVFAPIWTFAALNVAGMGLLTGALLKNTVTKEQAKFYFGQNWPAMYVLALVAGPMMLQALIWMMASGDGDDDRPFPWQNEVDRADSVLGMPYNWYVDVTPLVRMAPGYTGEPTGRRRQYVRFGKQAYEVVDGWLKEPAAQALRKLSNPAKLVIEELTGKSPGSDWNLEFAGQGFLGWFRVDKEGVDAFLGSRIGYVVQKYLPMSILTTIKNPDVWAISAIAPASKGMSQGKAVEELTKILNTYANETAWRQVQNKPAARETLAALAPAIMDALERNGYDSWKALNSAKGVVLGRLYSRIWKALEEKDFDEVDRLSMSVLRVGGSLKGLQQSVKQKGRQFGKEVSAEMTQAMYEAFGEEAPMELKPVRKVPIPVGAQVPAEDKAAKASAAAAKVEEREAKKQAAAEERAAKAKEAAVAKAKKAQETEKARQEKQKAQEAARAAKLETSVSSKIDRARRVHKLRYGTDPASPEDWERALKLAGISDQKVREALKLS